MPAAAVHKIRRAAGSSPAALLGIGFRLFDAHEAGAQAYALRDQRQLAARTCFASLIAFERSGSADCCQPREPMQRFSLRWPLRVWGGRPRAAEHSDRPPSNRLVRGLHSSSRSQSSRQSCLPFPHQRASADGNFIDRLGGAVVTTHIQDTPGSRARLDPDPRSRHRFIGVLAGLVASTCPPCYWVDSEGAFLLGIGAGLVVVWAIDLLEHLRIDDSIGAVPIHAAAGI